MSDGFSTEPLASRLRPDTLDDFVGQAHILGPGKPLRAAIESGQLHSMLFWGPPGVGKTTLAHIIADKSDAALEHLSAVLSGVKDIREAVARAEQRQAMSGQATLLFVDEVHRFNKSQQDAFLPFVENGTVVFIGATTENPSFELNNALLSRTRLYVLKPLDDAALSQLVQRGVGDSGIEDAALQRLLQVADGDGRRLLNLLELCLQLSEGEISLANTELVLQDSWRKFDKGGDQFYEQISALHKAVRGSSPDASLYWFVRMLDGGCDPRYIARRIIRMASEDIGNADPRALRIALDAADVYERLGSPEGELALAQAVLYLASAAKSNAAYVAYKAAINEVRSSKSHEVPIHLRNAPTKLHKEMGFGGEYRYAHDEDGGYAAGENYFPEALRHQRFYEPVERGLEQRIKEKLDYLRALDSKAPHKRYRD